MGGSKILKNNVLKLDIFKIALVLICICTILICATDDASAVNTGAEGYNAINVQSSQVSADSESTGITINNEFRDAKNAEFPDPGPVKDQSNYCDWVWSSINITNNGPDTTSVNVKDVGDGFVYYNPSIGWNGYVRSNNGTGWIWDDKFDVKTGNGTYNIPNGETYQIAILGYINKTGTIKNEVYQGADTVPSADATLNVPAAAMIRLNQEFRYAYNGSAVRNAYYRDRIYSVTTTKNDGPNAANVVYHIISSGFTSDGKYLVSKDNGATWVLNDGSFNVGTGMWTVNIPSNAIYLLAIHGQITETSVNSTVNQISQDVYNPYGSDNAKPKVLVVFDDGNVAQYNIAFEYMQTKGIPGTVYVNGNNIGQSGILSLSNLFDMNEAGWLIANHAYIHQNFQTLTDEEITDLISDQIDFLVNNGLTSGAYHLAYPGGYSAQNIYDIMNDLGIISGRTIYGNLVDNLNSLNLYQIPAYTIVNTDTVSTVKGYVDNAIATDSTIVLLFHNIKDTNPSQYEYLTSDFKNIIDYIADKGIECLTIDELYKQATIAPINIPSNRTVTTTGQSTTNGYATASAALSNILPSNADISVTQTTSNSNPNHLEDVTFTINITNLGPSSAEDVTSGYWLDGTYLTWVSDDSGGSYNNGVWTIGTLESGETRTLHVIAKVIATTGTTFTTSANYNSGSTPDPNVVNNHQTISLTVTQHIPTAVVVNPVNGFKGDVVNLIATLTDTENNLPIEGKTVEFKVNDLPVGTAITNAQGIATLPYTITQNFGTHTILAQILQDITYFGTTKTNNLNVARIPTAIVVNPVNGFKGDLVNLIATLTDTHNNIPLEGKTVQFKINDLPVGTAITNAQGIATLPYTITQNFGTHTILAQILEDTTYTATSNTNNLNIARIPTSITVNPVNGIIGNAVNLIATLTDTHNNIPIEGKTVEFKINDLSVGTAITNAQGIATLPYTITQNFGTHTILAQILEDTTYTATSNTNTLNVLDSTPPVVTSTSPVNNAVNVVLNKVIQINFDENIKLGTNPWIELKTNSGTVIPFTTTVLANVLSIIPDSLLAAGTKFIVVLHSNSITDIQGNGLAAPYTTKFTTITPPVVTSTNPVNNAVNVALNKVIQITFDKNIQFGTNPWIELVTSSTGTAKPFTTTITGNILNITPTTPLTKGTKYIVIIHSNAVTDTTGTVGLAAPYTTKFTTTTPPVVTSTSPVNNAVNVALNKVIQIKFNKNIKLGTNPWIELKTSSGTAKPFTTSITGNTLNITPNTPLAKGTNYTVIIHSNAVTDTTGTAGLAAAYTTKFKTTTV